jgi:4'-phosphopantetheinyl transferase
MSWPRSSPEAPVTLPAGEIHVWLAFDEQLSQAESVREFTALLEPGEIDRMGRLHLERRRHQFLITRALQRTVLADYLHAAPRELRFLAGEHGKPSLAAPFAGDGLHFNIAHSRGLVALAVGRAETLGVDVEYMKARTAPLALASRYFTAEEAGALSELPVVEQQRRFYALWTLKESWLKATGRGLAAGLANVSFDLDARHQATGVIVSNEPASGWRFWQASPTPEHGLALALRLDGAGGRELEPVVRLRAWRDPQAREFTVRPMNSGQEQRAQT